MGFRKKTRHLMQRSLREKGKISLSKYFQKFKEGDKVTLKINPAVQKGAFNTRFQGQAGIVKAKCGSCYEVIIKDLKKNKTILVHPVHLIKR